MDLHKHKEYILGLKDNWDGDGATPFLEDHWNRCQKFIDKLKALIPSLEVPRIRAVIDNTIDIDWITNEGKIGVNISNDSKDVVACTGKINDTEEYFEFNVHENDLVNIIVPWIKLLYEKKDIVIDEYHKKINPEYYKEENVKARKIVKYEINGVEYNNAKIFIDNHCKLGCRRFHIEIDLKNNGLYLPIDIVCEDCQKKRFKKWRKIIWKEDITDL